MKSLVVVTFALSFLAASFAAAQPQSGQYPAPGKPGVARKNETTGGKPANSTSHTYQKGDRLSLAYGSFDEAADWNGHHLTKPAEGEHWVYYGDNFLLARIDTGVIIDIVKASWEAGRG
jgi:Ni/Co efflux regulator RcnB